MKRFSDFIDEEILSPDKFVGVGDHMWHVSIKRGNKTLNRQIQTKEKSEDAVRKHPTLKKLGGKITITYKGVRK